jgi:hypothetical protein
LVSLRLLCFGDQQSRLFALWHCVPGHSDWSVVVLVNSILASPFSTAGPLVTVHWRRGKARGQSLDPSDNLVCLFTQKR